MDETAAKIAMIAAELNTEAMASYIEAQGMIVANEARRRDGKVDAYGEEAFMKLRDSLMASVGYSSTRVRDCY